MVGVLGLHAFCVTLLIPGSSAMKFIPNCPHLLHQQEGVSAQSPEDSASASSLRCVHSASRCNSKMMCMLSQVMQNLVHLRLTKSAASASTCYTITKPWRPWRSGSFHVLVIISFTPLVCGLGSPGLGYAQLAEVWFECVKCPDLH